MVLCNIAISDESGYNYIGFIFYVIGYISDDKNDTLLLLLLFLII